MKYLEQSDHQLHRRVAWRAYHVTRPEALRAMILAGNRIEDLLVTDEMDTKVISEAIEAWEDARDQYSGIEPE